MLVRRLCSALLPVVLAAGGVVLAAAPSHAESDSCSTATPFAGNTAGTVGPGDINDYWRFEATTGSYRVTLVGAANLSVYVSDTSCSSPDCFDTGSSKVCDVNVTAPQPVRVKASNFGTTTEAYTLSVEWRTQPTLGTQCADGVDNDGDGYADSADSGCAGLLDTTEGPADSGCQSVGVAVCLALTPGDEITSVNLYGPEVTDVPLTGSVDLYQFTLANDTVVNLPCVVVNGVNPCATLGGTFFARMAGIGPVNVPGVDPLIDEHLATVRLCEATLRATVADIGVQSLGAVTVC